MTNHPHHHYPPPHSPPPSPPPLSSSVPCSDTDLGGSAFELVDPINSRPGTTIASSDYTGSDEEEWAHQRPSLDHDHLRDSPATHWSLTAYDPSIAHLASCLPGQRSYPTPGQSLIIRPQSPFSLAQRPPTPEVEHEGHYFTQPEPVDESCVISDNSTSSITSLSYSFPDPTTSFQQQTGSQHSHSAEPRTPSALSEPDHESCSSANRPYSDQSWGTSSHSIGLLTPDSPRPHSIASPEDNNYYLSAEDQHFTLQQKEKPVRLPFDQALELESETAEPLVQLLTRCQPDKPRSFQKLDVYLLGDSIPAADLWELSLHIRTSFAHRPKLIEPQAISSSSSKASIAQRIHRAVSRVLHSPHTTPSHSTSWLQLVLHDLSTLSEDGQRSSLFCQPELPRLILCNQSVSFPPKFLDQHRHQVPLQILPILAGAPTTSAATTANDPNNNALNDSADDNCTKVYREFLSYADQNQLPLPIFAGRKQLRIEDLSKLSVWSSRELDQLLMDTDKPNQTSKARLSRYKGLSVICFLASLIAWFLVHSGNSWDLSWDRLVAGKTAFGSLLGTQDHNNHLASATCLILPNTTLRKPRRQLFKSSLDSKQPSFQLLGPAFNRNSSKYKERPRREIYQMNGNHTGFRVPDPIRDYKTPELIWSTTSKQRLMQFNRRKRVGRAPMRKNEVVDRFDNWIGRELPRRLRLGLKNIRERPDLCLNKIYKKSSRFFVG